MFKITDTFLLSHCHCAMCDLVLMSHLLSFKKSFKNVCNLNTFVTINFVFSEKKERKKEDGYE